MAGNQDAVMMLLAKRMMNPNYLATVHEMQLYGQLLELDAEAPEPGFPEHTPGDVNGVNELRRTNWFNGRFLTAEALRRQDAYFDLRSRLDAQTSTPGVAYGLGLKAPGLFGNRAQGADPRSGGFPANANIVLTPGLAFDLIGRPILVSDPFNFRLEQLITLYRNKPRRVVSTATDFSPCICLAPDPEGPTGGAAAIRPGPYILVIEPGESRDGTAKVYGNVCGGDQPSTCEADAWRGGFGLSLVRFPAEIPEKDDVRTPFDLRGLLSAYYFDVFEHSLPHRWDPLFAADESFCDPVRPARHDKGAVALAMVYIGTDGSAVFVDPWIPRRSIVASSGEDWHRTRFGAPPRAAAWARIHQFQCMLANSLAAEAADVKRMSGNLYRRGFRHIPPIGFLPIRPKPLGAEDRRPTGIAIVDAMLLAGGAQAGMISGFVAGARDQGKAYFEGTNVLTYCVVALHDDDILEDLSNVFDKDPVQLDRARSLYDPGAQGGLSNVGSSVNSDASLQQRLWATIGDSLLSRLVNRRLEVVKLMVPLQGLVRQWPLVGVLPEDAQDQAAGWGAASLTPPSQTIGLAGFIRQGGGPTMLPRHFVVYVKQRLVLLDVLFMLFEALLALLDLVRTGSFFKVGETPPPPPPPAPAGAVTAPSPPQRAYAMTADYRRAWAEMPVEKRTMAEAALTHPQAREALSLALPLAERQLAVGGRLETFRAKVATEEAAVRGVTDPAAKKQLALDRVADAYAAEYPGFAVIQAIAATQPAEHTEALLADMDRGAALVRTGGGAPEKTVAEDLGVQPTVFADTAAARLHGEVRWAIRETPAKDLSSAATAPVNVGDVLAKSPAEAKALLGDAAFAKFTAEATNRLNASTEAVRKVTAAPPPGAAKKLDEALTTSRGDADKAVKAARRGAPAATATYFDNTATLVKVLGPERGAALVRDIAARAPR
jgi:hypothetical protein